MAKKMQSLLQVAIVAALLSPAAVPIFPADAVAQTSPPFYVNREHRFAIIFPGEPAVKDIAYATGEGRSVPAHQFSFEQDTNHHIITVVDLSAGPAVDAGAVERAADELRRRGEVRFQAADEYDPGLPGRQLNIFEGNGRQLRASVYMWDHRLYITEASGVPGASSLLQFEQSITILDAQGNELNLDGAAFSGAP